MATASREPDRSTQVLPQPEPPRPRSADRAFVVQFDAVRGGRSRLTGRVEVVGSGDAARFRSVKQLVDFVVGTVRGKKGRTT